MTDYSQLASDVAGPVFDPQTEGYAQELLGINLVFTHTPDVVVGVTSAADVSAAVRFAAAHSLPVRVLATGHGVHSAITDGLVLTTKRLDAVEIDAQTGVATIGAGVRWASVVEAAAPLGLAPVTGSAAGVGVVGFLLGGGVGPLARSHGFGSDFVLSFSVVIGTGELVEASDTENPDLYWALRGGKGGLGIVTSVRVQLVELSEIYGGNMLFEAEHIENVLRTWVDFTATAPDGLTTSVAIMRFPPLDVVPAPLRGKTLLALRVAYPVSAEVGERAIAPLRAAAPAMMDNVGVLPVAAIATIHNDPTDPGKAWTSGGMLSSVDQDLATAVLGVVGAGKQVPLVAFELRHIGAATGTDVAGGSAVGGRGNDFTFMLIASLMQPGIEGAVEAAAADVLDAIAPWVSPETTINFAGPAHDVAQFATSWPADTFARLASVRSTYDPDRVFVFGPAE